MNDEIKKIKEHIIKEKQMLLSIAKDESFNFIKTGKIKHKNNAKENINMIYALDGVLKLIENRGYSISQINEFEREK